MRQDADRRRLFARRALVVGAGQLGLLGILAGRLWQLQVRDGAAYALLADDNRISQRLLVPARGRILDRHGRALAVDRATYRVRVIREQAGDLKAALGRLAALIPVPPERLAAATQEARQLRPFIPVTVRDDLSWDEVARIAVRAVDLPGIILDSGLTRHYPEGGMVANVLGYVGAVSPAEQGRDPDPLLELPETRIGKNGLERSYDRRLRGRAGRLRVEVNAVGREVRELERRGSEPGRDLALSLDLELQRYCVQRLASETAAAAVILDVRSGAVLAMASVPGFDPAVFAGGMRPASWASLRDDPRTPLLNKCVRGQYPPGSTFKMMTALAGLKAGAITKDTVVTCGGQTWLGNASFHCWKEHGHGPLSLIQGIGQSCDVYFYEVARRTGIDAIAAMGRRFGLGGEVGVDLPGERPGLLPTQAWKRATTGEGWQQGETLVCGIGQGFVLATPLQLATMAARLANGRDALGPRLAAEAGPAPPALDVDPAHLALVTAGMREVVHGLRGTAKQADLGLPGIELAGKTGSAQVRRITRRERETREYKRDDIPWVEREHAWFVCFAPYTRPRYALSVLVEHGGSGAKAAAPIARDLMRKALELDPAADAPAAVAELAAAARS